MIIDVNVKTSALKKNQIFVMKVINHKREELKKKQLKHQHSKLYMKYKDNVVLLYSIVYRKFIV